MGRGREERREEVRGVLWSAKIFKITPEKTALFWQLLLFDKGPEYGTTKTTLKGALDEAEHVADVHLTIKSRLLSEVQAQIKEWKNENYKKQMVGGCKETKLFEDEFHKVRCCVDRNPKSVF